MWSLFWQHLVSNIPALYAIVVHILDDEYYVYGGDLDAKALTMLLFMGA